jgi:peptidoglycan/LPS O-acetylase OafA/YrhL
MLLLLWRRAGTLRTAACVMVVSAAAAAALLAGHQWPMGNFAKYWIIWLSGAVLAEWARTNSLPQWRWWYSVLGAGAAVAAVLGRALGVNVGIEHFAWGAAYFVLVLWGLGRPHIVSALPSRIRKAGLFLGSISYSLYLVHFPVLVVAGAAWIAMFGGKPASVAIPLVASLLPVPAAYALWRFVERPSQAYGRALSSSPAPVAAPAAARLA